MTVRTPSPPSADPNTGNTVPGAVVETVTKAYLAQQPVADSSLVLELAAQQDTTIARFTVLVPPGVDLAATSEVVDEDGQVYRVAGPPAVRRGLGRRVLFRAASLHLISDLQD